MLCPHCNVGIHLELDYRMIGDDIKGTWYHLSGKCSACSNMIIYLERNESEYPVDSMNVAQIIPVERLLVYPKVSNIKTPHPSVPSNIKNDFLEASLILNDSPKASAALSRRCLQSILRDKAGVKKGNLEKEILQAMEQLPTHIAGAIDAVRQIGNFAAHPMKSESTGQIVDVEPEEAKWNLDVLESLFDFYYIQPSILAEKQEALNKKLADIGKPPMKTFN